MELFLTPLIDFVSKPDRTKIRQADGLDEHRSLISDSQLRRILLEAGCSKKALANGSYRSHIVSATVTFSDQVFRQRYSQWIFSRYSRSPEQDHQVWGAESDVLSDWAQQFNSIHRNLKIISIHSLINHSTFEARIKMIGFTVRKPHSSANRFSFDFAKVLKTKFHDQNAAQAYYLFEIYEGHNLARAMQKLFGFVIPEAHLTFISVKPNYEDILKLIPHKTGDGNQKRTAKHRFHEHQSTQDSSQTSHFAKAPKSAATASVSNRSASEASSGEISGESSSRTAKSQSMVVSQVSSSVTSGHSSATVKSSIESVNSSSSYELSKSQTQPSSSSNSSANDSSSKSITSGTFRSIHASSVFSSSHRSNEGREASLSQPVTSKVADHKRNVKQTRSLKAINSHAASIFDSKIKSLTSNIERNQNELSRLTSQMKQHRADFREVMRESANGFKPNQPIRIVSSGLMLLNSHVQDLSKALHNNLSVISQLSTQYTDQMHGSYHKSKGRKNHKRRHKWFHKFRL